MYYRIVGKRACSGVTCASSSRFYLLVSLPTKGPRTRPGWEASHLYAGRRGIRTRHTFPAVQIPESIFESREHDWDTKLGFVLDMPAAVDTTPHGAPLPILPILPVNDLVIRSMTADPIEIERFDFLISMKR